MTPIMSEERLEITESDEAGHVTATYVQSRVDQDEATRIDVIVRALIHLERGSGLISAASCRIMQNHHGRGC